MSFAPPTVNCAAHSSLSPQMTDKIKSPHTAEPVSSAPTNNAANFTQSPTKPTTAPSPAPDFEAAPVAKDSEYSYVEADSKELPVLTPSRKHQRVC